MNYFWHRNLIDEQLPAINSNQKIETASGKIDSDDISRKVSLGEISSQLENVNESCTSNHLLITLEKSEFQINENVLRLSWTDRSFIIAMILMSINAVNI